MGAIETAWRDFIVELGQSILGTRVITDPKTQTMRTVPSISDSGSDFSVAIGHELLKSLTQAGIPWTTSASDSANTIGAALVPATINFLDATLNGPMQRIRPVAWRFQSGGTISTTSQYRHLAVLQRLHNDRDRLVVEPKNTGPVSAVKAEEERVETLVALSGQYIVRPDLLVLRPALNDVDLNPPGQQPAFDPEGPTGSVTELRREQGAGTARRRYPRCHANVSLKWTFRSDRAQNVRTEALQMIRQRRGPMPHMVALTGEPLPSRLESLARGTGELDALYHVALHPLIEGLQRLAKGGAFQDAAEKALPVIYALRDTGRIKDITDLPFDLAA